MSSKRSTTSGKAESRTPPLTREFSGTYRVCFTHERLAKVENCNEVICVRILSPNFRISTEFYEKFGQDWESRNPGIPLS